MTDSIQYIGEHLIPGRIGHFAILLGFVASLFSFFAYRFAHRRRAQGDFQSWLRIARIGFLVQALSVFTIIGLLFYIMIQQYYEYEYVRLHVSDQLPMRYIAAAFWEGQEGSFLLWMFWHVILGIVALQASRKWETGVMGTLALIQAFLFSMILGVYIPIGEVYKIGSNPFMLVRDILDAPIFNSPDYVQKLKGNGLNPLLQNYWMTIHPPTLFLGFASVTMPFAFAMAALEQRSYSEWLKPVLPWALFSGAILGTGILMGGAWAYEALSFGGYWAWDPVENMSLVPWLILIAGLHTNLVANASGHSLRSTFLFYIFSFCLILYSTFLTRSGVLGDSSVHAFTEMGLEWQLIIFLLFFLSWSLYRYFSNHKAIPAPAQEEPSSSREFWMFIGALVLVFSSVLITFTTSIPVYNKILDGFGSLLGKDFSDMHRSSPLDPVGHHNKFQLWIAVFISLLSAVAIFLRYKLPVGGGSMGKLLRRLGIHLLISGLLTYLFTLWLQLPSWQYVVLMLAALFGTVSNLDYLVFYMRSRMKNAGSTLSHLGFGIMVAGILASGLNKEHVSSNPMTMRGLLDDESIGKNILLYKGLPMFMSGYEVTYQADSLEGFYRKYTINYLRRDSTGKVLETFDLHPNVVYDKSMSKIAATNPSTQHYLDKDIFTHIAQLPREQMEAEAAQAKEDSLKFKLLFAELNDSVKIDKGHMVARKIYFDPKHPEYKAQAGDLALGVDLSFSNPRFDTSYIASPVIVLRDGLVYNYPAVVNPLEIKARLSDTIFDALLGKKSKLELGSFELRQGESANFQDIRIRFKEFVRDPKMDGYEAQAGDIAIASTIELYSAHGDTLEAQPMYLIRDQKASDYPVYLSRLGTEVRLTGLNPERETVQVELRKWNTAELAIPVEVAENYSRADFVVLEAIIFPGINLFWLGSVLMMLGLALSFLNKRRLGRAA